jgi:acetyl-CoA synthetase
MPAHSEGGQRTPPVWRPGPDELRRSRLAAFCRELGYADPTALDAAARRDPAWFWQAVTDWLDLDWQTAPAATVDQLEVGHQSHWFPGGSLNLADNAVDRWVRRGRGDQPARVWEREDGSRGTFTFAELAAQVDRVGHGLLALGVRFGDRVGIQLPMVAEAAVTALACAKIGAIAVPVFSGFGPTAVADRLRLAGASVHVVADGFTRRGRVIPLRATVAEALAAAPSVQRTIVVPLAGQPVSGPALPGEIGWADLLASAGPATPLPAAVCPTDHPLFIAFTSGTTGAPKGVVLGHAGFAVKAASDVAFCFDIGAGDVATWITDPGWIMSPIIVYGGLLVGATVALYDGAVDHPGPDRLWALVRELGITMLGVSPTLVRSLMTAGPLDQAPDLGPLRVLASSGEPWTPDAFSWLFDRVTGGRLPVINYSGGTEVSGAIVSNTTITPIHACGFAGPVPGMAADVVDDAADPIGRGIGELVLRAPSPGMPLGFWGAPGRYQATYWARWDNVWCHGDWVEIDADGVWFIRGRSDDTIKVAGKRLGPAEVESVVNGFPAVTESAAIGVPDPVKGQAVVVFARLDPGASTDEQALRDEIVAALTAQLGKPLKPKAVHFVDALPHTRSGKILRRVVRAVHLGEDVGTAAVDEAAALDAVRNAR